MADVLELKDGNCITPLGLFDLMDYIEEYMGVEVRQYIEEAIMEGDESRDWTEEERYETLKEHYTQVLLNVDDAATELERKLAAGRLDREVLRYHAGRVRMIIRNELTEGAE